MSRAITLLTCMFILSCQSSARFRAPSNKPVYKSQSSYKTDLESFVDDWLGVPYRYGGNTNRGIDCSGFTSLAYKQCFGKSIPRTSMDQYHQGNRISRRNLKPGDLGFFSNVRHGKIDHVGIYLGSERFAHATESSGVTISQLTEEYYEKRFAGACTY